MSDSSLLSHSFHQATDSTTAGTATEDNDDEDALRQLLLKLLANKKKVRQVSYVGMEQVGFEPMTQPSQNH